MGCLGGWGRATASPQYTITWGLTLSLDPSHGQTHGEFCYTTFFHESRKAI